MVEPSTVNRVVPGSNPGGGAKDNGFPTQRMSTIQSGIGIQHPQPGPRENSDEAVKNGARRVLHHCLIWSVHLGVRIQGFHPCHTGSNPVPTTIAVLPTPRVSESLKGVQSVLQGRPRQ